MIIYTVRINLAIFGSQSTDANKGTKALKTEHNKYTMDPGQSSLSQNEENIFWLKMIFEQKQIRKMHKSCIIND